ncbi:hypothetical protein Ddye_029304 [Dipteronia dyeriana]|uniref:Uncharacterized protein n=1 Tax=Dipteronia dyeriana TaxID=168575 RepID=A0AAD9TEW2_9ROSI|nr:hypothetical protein Ddye_029304 [Dipteronia dyeriana]
MPKQTLSKNIDKSMDWFYTKRRGPEWKQGWSGQTLVSVSVVLPPLLAVFCSFALTLAFSVHRLQGSVTSVATQNY